MTDRSKLLALAEAVEKLRGPDREVMYAAFDACLPRSIPSEPNVVVWAREWLRFQRFIHVEAWLDAAMMLVPERWETEALGQGYGGTSRGKWHCVLYTRNAGLGPRSSTADPFTGSHDAATPALALTAAALRAQAEALS